MHDGFIRGTATATGGQATPFKPAPAAPSRPRRPRQQVRRLFPSRRLRPPQHRRRAAAPPPAAAPAALAAPPAAGGLELVFRPDPMVWDGRFANNGWLQEAPKPLTKLTWDTAAWISPKLAEEKSLDRGDIIELKYRGATTRMPVFIVPGQPDQSVTVFLGYGRRMAGRVGTASEEAQAFNAYRLRTSDAPVVRHRPRDRQDGRSLSARHDAGPSRDGRPAPGAGRHARGVHARARSRLAHGARVPARR